MLKVLFVCLGNICRSPTAHGVLLRKLEEAGLSSQVEVDSAGTADWHAGRSPDERSMMFAKQRSYDLSQLRARSVCDEDFSVFDYILAMDNNNLENLIEIYNEVSGTRPQLFLASFSQNFDEREVPDPYYGGDAGFRHVLDLIEDACDGLIAELQRRLKASERS